MRTHAAMTHNNRETGQVVTAERVSGKLGQPQNGLASGWRQGYTATGADMHHRRYRRKTTKMLCMQSLQRNCKIRQILMIPPTHVTPVQETLDTTSDISQDRSSRGWHVVKIGVEQQDLEAHEQSTGQRSWKTTRLHKSWWM